MAFPKSKTPAQKFTELIKMCAYLLQSKLEANLITTYLTERDLHGHGDFVLHYFVGIQVVRSPLHGSHIHFVVVSPGC